MTSASNNVYPKRFTPFTFGFTRKDFHKEFTNFSDKELFLLDIIRSVREGSLQLTRSVSSKYRYAFKRLHDEDLQTNLDIHDLYFRFKETKSALIEKTLKVTVARFEELLTSKDIKGEYLIGAGPGRYVFSLTKNTYRYTSQPVWAKRYSGFKKAWCVSQEITGSSLIRLEEVKNM